MHANVCEKHKHNYKNMFINIHMIFSIYLCFNCNVLSWNSIIVLICSISLPI